MWARVAEILLALWLGVAPFVLREGSSTQSAVDLGAAGLILGCSVASVRHAWHRAHLLIFPIALGLAGRAWLIASHPAEPLLQNDLLVGLTLLLFAAVPTDASYPPPDWEPYFTGENKE